MGRSDETSDIRGEHRAKYHRQRFSQRANNARALQILILIILVLRRRLLWGVTIHSFQANILLNHILEINESSNALRLLFLFLLVLLRFLLFRSYRQKIGCALSAHENKKKNKLPKAFKLRRVQTNEYRSKTENSR